MADQEHDETMYTNDADVERRFRDLELDEQIRRMRGGEAPESPAGHAEDARTSTTQQAPRAAAGTDGADDLSAMKAALEDDGPLERFVLAVCPHCGGKNRVSLERLRGGEPRCGRCKKDLSFTRF